MHFKNERCPPDDSGKKEAACLRLAIVTVKMNKKGKPVSEFVYPNKNLFRVGLNANRSVFSFSKAGKR